ncbi:large ribosomal subunit protein mL38-like [Lycorma delicatula]|uniref:large ribosomal subunit protein mL38-like n=1 Tax=Lycorma delicatula TaxID=130591 RepID=UPI003F5165AF
MASRFYRLFIGDVNIIKKPFVRNSVIRTRGTPPNRAKTLQQRLEEINYKDPSIYYKVDIGLPRQARKRNEEISEKLSHLKKVRNNPELEKLARANKLTIPLDEVYEDWKKTVGPYQIKDIAEHYGIFNDLYGDAFFLPIVIMDISYKSNEGFVPVFRGNDVKPSQASAAPEVVYEAPSNTLWTLILTNPDGHLTHDNAEYVHWFIGNIPGSDVKKGEVVWDYLQPFPPHGTGYHRYIFVLYKQDKIIDFSKLKKPSPCLELDNRTFHTYDFYREHQDVLTPAGLSFFQSDWEPSLTDFFHNTLNMKEPIFEYDFDPPYVRKQEWFPLRKAFNIYLDKYRDPKQISKEFLLKKLKKTHPFKKPPPPLPFPNAIPFKRGTPSWVITEMRKERLQRGRSVYHENLP